MHEDTDAERDERAVVGVAQLVARGIVANLLAVVLDGDVPVAVEVGRMGPDVVHGVGMGGLSDAGVEKVDVVHVAVVVVVIVGEVDLVVQLLAGIHHHLSGAEVRPLVIAAVPGGLVVERDGAHDHVFMVELVVRRLVVEVHGRAVGAVAPGEAALVEHAGVVVLGVVDAGELGVAELDEEHEALALARRGEVVHAELEAALRAPSFGGLSVTLLHGLALLHGLLIVGLGARVELEHLRRGIPSHALAVVGEQLVPELVAVHANGDHLAVGLAHLLGRRVGRNGNSRADPE